MLPGLEDEIVTSRMLTPQDFQDRLLSFRGAAFGLEPVLTQSAWFRPHNRSEEVEASISSAPARIPAPACPACSRRPASSTWWCPMPPRWSEPDMRIAGGSRRLPRDCCAPARRRSTPPRCCCRRASREPATALYAFCRLADDAVDLDGGRPAALAQLRERLDARLCTAGRCRTRSTARCADVVGAIRHSQRRCPKPCSRASRGMRDGRRYDDLAELQAYAARVAGTVGAMMALLMGVRDARCAGARLRPRRRDAAHQHRARRRRGCPRRPALSAAALAARGRHRSRRLAGPAGVRPGAGLRGPAPAGCRRRAVPASQRRHRAAAAGCRPGIQAARLLYAEIGREVERRGRDLVARRVVVPLPRKLGLLGRALVAAALQAPSAASTSRPRARSCGCCARRRSRTASSTTSCSRAARARSCSCSTAATAARSARDSCPRVRRRSTSSTASRAGPGDPLGVDRARVRVRGGRPGDRHQRARARGAGLAVHPQRRRRPAQRRRRPRRRRPHLGR